MNIVPAPIQAEVKKFGALVKARRRWRAAPRLVQCPCGRRYPIKHRRCPACGEHEATDWNLSE